MKHEYHEGPKAREKFYEGMRTLFRAPKLPVKQENPKPIAKPKASKD